MIAEVLLRPPWLLQSLKHLPSTLCEAFYFSSLHRNWCLLFLSICLLRLSVCLHCAFLWHSSVFYCPKKALKSFFKEAVEQDVM